MTELGSPKPGVVSRNAAGNHPEFSKPDLPAQKPPAQGAKSSLKKPSSRKNRSPAPCCRCSAKLKQKNRFLTSGLPGLWFAFLVVSAAGSFSAEQFVATEISQAPDLPFIYTAGSASRWQFCNPHRSPFLPPITAQTSVLVHGHTPSCNPLWFVVFCTNTLLGAFNLPSFAKSRPHGGKCQQKKNQKRS